MGVTNMPEKANPLINLAAGGVSGAVAKTITAPLEKVKLAIQNQDSNPRALSGEMKRYTGMVDCAKRHVSELGASSLWRGNVANCVRYVPTAAFNLMFKDTIKGMFPKYNKNTDFGMFAATQIASGAFAGGITNTLVWRIVWRKLRRRVASSLSTMVFLHHLSASSSTEVSSSVCRTSLRLSTHTSMMSLWSESCPSS